MISFRTPRCMQFVSLLVVAIPFAATYVSAQKASEECLRTSSMRVYSNAWLSKETGDLNGFEVALKQTADSKIDALLYVYEGGLSDGIPLPGGASGNNVTIEGAWVEHLVEYPSKKEIIKTHQVKILGTLDSKSFRGKLTIRDLSVDEDVKLRRVGNIWPCKR